MKLNILHENISKYKTVSASYFQGMSSIFLLMHELSLHYFKLYWAFFDIASIHSAIYIIEIYFFHTLSVIYYKFLLLWDNNCYLPLLLNNQGHKQKLRLRMRLRLVTRSVWLQKRDIFKIKRIKNNSLKKLIS